MSPIRLGLAAGIIFGLCTLLTTWLSIWFGYATEYLNMLVSIYPGFHITGIGSIVGMIYGFANFFIFFGLLGLLHNWFEELSFYS